MRRIVNSTFVSLDGVINHMDRWHFGFIDDELEALALDQMRALFVALFPRGLGRFVPTVRALPAERTGFHPLAKLPLHFVIRRALQHTEAVEGARRLRRIAHGNHQDT